MIQNLIAPSSIKKMRLRYDEALKLRGVPAQYQFPILATSNYQGEPLIDHYSEKENVQIFMENATIKTMKRYGWVVANSDDLPLLIHCSWNLKNMQKDCLFRTSGLLTDLPEQIFRVTEISYIAECPDHLVAAVVPVYDETTILGRTPKEVAQTFNTSNHFLKPVSTYHGEYHTTKEDISKN